MPTYRQRLRLEGLVLALCGAVGSVVLVVLDDGATANSASTIVQLFVLTGLVVTAGPLLVERWAREARQAEPSWSGDPTPLWTLPVICAALAVPFWALAPDAGLRITGGCIVVGLGQAFVLERAAAKAERRLAGSLVRAPGSKIYATRLGVLREG